MGRIIDNLFCVSHCHVAFAYFLLCYKLILWSKDPQFTVLKDHLLVHGLRRWISESHVLHSEGIIKADLLRCKAVLVLSDNIGGSQSSCRSWTHWSAHWATKAWSCAWASQKTTRVWIRSRCWCSSVKTNSLSLSGGSRSLERLRGRDGRCSCRRCLWSRLQRCRRPRNEALSGLIWLWTRINLFSCNRLHWIRCISRSLKASSGCRRSSWPIWSDHLSSGEGLYSI